MSLLRLLTAGKSLVNIQDAEPRYRTTTQRLLPKFGSAKNPFQGRKAATPAPAPVDQPSPDPVAAPVAEPTQSAAPSPGRGLWLKAAARMSAWAGKLTERFMRPNPKPAKAAIPHFSKPPVQAELSLDRIRVVRNDLSDADLDVVPARPKAAPAAVPVEPERAVPSPMGRVRARLFGAGKT
jgi:hypothetical protein